MWFFGGGVTLGENILLILKYLILCDMPGIQETGWSGEILF